MPWFDLRVRLNVVPLIADRFMRDADVVVANHWPTAYPVAALSSSKGKKFHFIRDVEPEPHNGHNVFDSYLLPMSKIVSIPWVKQHLQEKIGVDVCGVVTNGTNMSEFGVADKEYNSDPTVCMMYHENPRKGTENGLTVLTEVKRRYPQVNIVMFGLKKPGSLPVDAAFHLRASREQLRSIYAHSDIFVCPSLWEGFHNPPREAMAAQCAVVATNVGSIPYCAIPGETALVVEPGDVAGMVESVCGLIERPQQIRELGRRGYEHIQQFTWNRAAAELLELFARC